MSSTQPQPRTSAHAKPRRRTPWLIGLGLAAAALLGTIVILTTPADEAPAAIPTSSASSTPSSPPTDKSDASSPAATNEAQSPEPIDHTPPIPMQQPIELDATAQPLTGLIARVQNLEAVQGEARGKGEVAGPAVRFEITLENTTGATASLASTVVNVDFGDARTPASSLAEPGARPLPDTLAPGASASGVYIFTVPLDKRESIRILLDYSVDVPITVFEGQAPR